MKRLGLLGGTFDPPHYGHLLAAQEVAAQLQLACVLFLPAQQNPLKQGVASSAAEDRCEMVARAIAGNPLFALSKRDLERPPPSYTVDLLQNLQAADRELVFLVGADILPELPRWRYPEEILRLARLAVITRPGSPFPDLRELEAVFPVARGRADIVRIPGVDISAAEMRARVRSGQSIRYLTPPGVEQYIRDRQLYQPESLSRL
ncbi:MAG: nicotinate-nucleotide adenylyltransferase [Chloroflexota bacterium]